MTPIDAVLFDFGMVLCVAPSKTVWQVMQRLLDCDEDTLQREYWTERDAYDRGTLTGEQYWRRIAMRLNAPGPHTVDALLKADIDLWSQPNMPMVDWAERLQKSHVPTGILSNLGDAIETGLRSRLPWLEQFEPKVFSHRVGTAKPDSKIFGHAIEQFAVAADRILFIDDRLDNISAARHAGLVAVPYLSHGDFLSQLAALGETGLPSSL